jgi:hypothetical protein
MRKLQAVQQQQQQQRERAMLQAPLLVWISSSGRCQRTLVLA